MSIESVNSASQVSFSSTKVTAETKTQPKTEQKGDKKKLMLALAGLATVGVASVGITMAIKKGKVPKELSIEEFKKLGKFDKGQALVKGKPYTGTIEVANKEGKFALEYIDGKLTKSTKFSEVDLDGSKVKNALTSKTYLDGENGTKIIKKTAKDGRLLTETVIGKNEVVRTQHAEVNGFYKGKLTHNTIKQKDGSWLSIRETYECKDGDFFKITKNANTGEILEKKAVNSLGQDIKAQEEIFDLFGSKKAQSELVGAIEAFKKSGYFTEDFKAPNLEDLKKGLTDIQETSTTDVFKTIRGKMPNGNTRTIYLNGGNVYGIDELRQNGACMGGSLKIIFNNEEGGRISSFVSSRDIGCGYNGDIEFEVKNGIVSRFSLANPESKWIPHEYSCDESNPIKLF
ncbi:MAG: hypothetical protein IKU37_03240 [Candidatus Gastranaerophilales bacterium]|nr:hypothetical protein [Candidatus Gastranaerophilales bacterium]